MPWPKTILEQFDTLNRETNDESEYYGPYNTLLTYLFPHSEHYQVTPQFKRPFPGSIDFTAAYIVRKRKCPVFFIEIKPYPHLDEISTRATANMQMREQYESIVGRNLVLPKLYGISAMGTCFSVYEYDKETHAINPPTVPRDPNHFMKDIAPASWWNYELMDDEGEKKLRELVANIKRMCQDITDCTYFLLPVAALGLPTVPGTVPAVPKRLDAGSHLSVPVPSYPFTNVQPGRVRVNDGRTRPKNKLSMKTE